MSGTSGANDVGQATTVHGENDATMNDVDQLPRAVQRKVIVKSRGGVVATVVVTARRGEAWLSIQPPFAWEAIMEPGKVDELMRTLALAAEDAKKMTSSENAPRGGSQPVGGRTVAPGNKTVGTKKVQP
jgi:hypothetical protein